MAVSPETLLAFVEGELSPEEARKVAAEVANDPSLAAHVENHKTLKARMQAASLPPAPSRSGAQGQAAGSPSAAPQGNTGARNPSRLAGSGWIAPGAMAVGIGLGVLLMLSLGPGSEIRSADGSAVAQGPLERALSSVIAVDQDDDASAHIGESFFSSDGYFCRNFTTASPGKTALAGIACREGSEWRIRVLASAAAPEGANGNAKAAPLPAAVRTALNGMMAGRPLDAEGERAARAQNWVVR